MFRPMANEHKDLISSRVDEFLALNDRVDRELWFEEFARRTDSWDLPRYVAILMAEQKTRPNGNFSGEGVYGC